jgi:hypothetical protein
MNDEHTSAIGEEYEIESTLFASIPSTYKVRGKLATAGSTGVFGYNQAGSGSGRGVFGRVDSGANDAAGVRGEAANGTAGAAGDGVVGITDDPGANNTFAAGVRGEASESADTQTAGVYGRTAGTAAGARGVNGLADNASGGKTYGVVGTSFGSGTEAAGVLGAAVDGSAKNYGVEGTTASAGTGAAGVKGSADTAAGQTYGVHGTTASPATDAAGVRGEATESSGTTYGVYGATNSPSGYGVYSADDAWVGGTLDVVGAASANSLSTTNNVDAGNDLIATNDLNIGGYQNIGEVGSTAWLGESDVSVGNSNLIVVPYDQIQRNDRNEFDAGTNRFICETEGQYHVTASVQWGVEAFGSYSETFDLYIYKNDAPVAQLLGQRGRSCSISKTILATDGDEIVIRVEQFTGGSVNLQASQAGTFVTIDKIG